ANLYGKDDPELGIGDGLVSLEAGLRLRYEIRREIAPYIGVNWEKQYGDTADMTRAAGGKTEEGTVVAGIRFWF
ncbi:copper resistance protein B, partial [Alcanivorax sp. HI0044]